MYVAEWKDEVDTWILYMCVGMYTCAWECIHVRGSVYMCVGVYTCAWECIHVRIIDVLVDTSGIDTYIIHVLHL